MLEVMHQHKKLAPESGIKVTAPISGAYVFRLNICFVSITGMLKINVMVLAR